MKEGEKRRYDPERRDRILDAALDVIAEYGVAGATHRRIAAAADVPLGSMTYHFSGIEEVVFAAFRRFAGAVAQLYRARLEAAENVAAARAAVVDIICGDIWADRRNLALTFELYAYAGRNPALFSIWSQWMADSRAALRAHFSPQTARALDAIIEGVTIHNHAVPGIIPRPEVERMVAAISGG